MRNLALIAMLCATSACAGSSFIPAPSNAPVFQPPAQTRTQTPQTSQGPASIISQPARSLTSRFGEARIDLTEGDARKLQFAGRTCVLDVFLYPRGNTAQPVATHVEARLRDGGAATDSEACAREIARR
ncbi:hypothetical protein [Erythrobacter rubeus]|uniref:Uncharacterized protein n=1 Tax=Erythrobacter rubeus TaxID=2760803 RepID=A0ABR8KT50_9SPHN|nr:hypothetical protein [Erythrobacter rubeus]MBD2843149.1 hypothetical protein [Erythrobacter rubeus]